MNYIKYLESKDGTKLYTKVNEVKESKANIIIAHGLAEHLDRYDELVAFLNEHHYNVVRFDQRGHGRSEGKRVFYSHVDEIIDDLDRIINYTKENYSGRVFLIGHSMGGYAVTLFGTKYPNKVDGIIISGALTRYNKRTFGEPDKNISADTYVKNELEDGVCSDEEIIQKYRDDDLVAKEISIGLIFTLMDGIAYLKEHPSHFIDPVLILHGKEDGLVSYKDSIDLYNEIASKKKSLYIYENLQHEIFNESSYNQSIFRDIIDWLDSKNR